MLARVAFLGALLGALAGCTLETVEGNYTCADPDKGHRGPDGKPDPCHHQDAVADAGPSCDVGDYVHWPIKWHDPTLLWFGPAEQTPECPRGPTTVAYEGQTDLVAPSACEACTCEPSAGSCALPSILTTSTTTCGDFASGSPTSFNAPTPWDGSCDSTTQTPDGAAHSLTIGPITITESGCPSGPPIAAKIASLHWDTFARACDVDLLTGPVNNSICLSESLVSPGFALCVFREGENACPTDPGTVFTEQHIFYSGVEDDRQCSSCTCGSPTGSACTAMLSVYKGNDLTCNGPALAQNTISSAGPVCIDVALPGQSLGSKSIKSTTYLPGTCPPMGGDESGSAMPTEPDTFCCRPSTF
jgi:hypothetical protein